MVIFIHKGLNKRVQILSMLVKSSSIAHSRWATDPILALTIYRMEMDEKMDGDGVLAMSGLGPVLAVAKSDPRSATRPRLIISGLHNPRRSERRSATNGRFRCATFTIARFMMGETSEHGGEKGILIRLQSQWSFGVNTLPPT